MTLADLIKWVEAHPTTIGIVLFALAGLKIFKKITLRSKLEIIDTASLCFIEEKDEFEDHKNLVRVAFLINASVRNPSNEKIVVESFSLSYLTKRSFRAWSQNLYRRTLPNRPRTKMGSGVKYSNVFFTNYPDDLQSLTMNGVIDPKEYQGGYIFFVSFTWGTWNPRFVNEKIKIRFQAKLTTGETCKDSASIRITKDRDFIENFIPGILDQIDHHTSWGIPND